MEWATDSSAKGTVDRFPESRATYLFIGEGGALAEFGKAPFVLKAPRLFTSVSAIYVTASGKTSFTKIH